MRATDRQCSIEQKRPVRSVGAEDADRVGANADERGVTEADHPAIAEYEVERYRGDGEDRDPRRHVDIEGCSDQVEDGRQRQQECDSRHRSEGSGGDLRH